MDVCGGKERINLMKYSNSKEATSKRQFQNNSKKQRKDIVISYFLWFGWANALGWALQKHLYWRSHCFDCDRISCNPNAINKIVLDGKQLKFYFKCSILILTEGFWSNWLFDVLKQTQYHTLPKVWLDLSKNWCAYSKQNTRPDFNRINL